MEMSYVHVRQSSCVRRVFTPGPRLWLINRLGLEYTERTLTVLIKSVLLFRQTPLYQPGRVSLSVCLVKHPFCLSGNKTSCAIG